MRTEHQRRALAIASIVGGIALILYLVAGNTNMIDWGTPGTAAYRTYEIFNRLMALPLACIGMGIVGMYLQQRRQLRVFGTVSFMVVLTGIALMLVGNIAEFWLFTDSPYAEGSPRNLAWAIFLVGVLLTVMGSVFIGLATWCAKVFPRWSAVIFPITLPFGIASIVFGILLWLS